MNLEPVSAQRRYLELASVLGIALLVLGCATFGHGPVGKVQQLEPDTFETVGVPSLWFLLSVPLTAAAPLLALRRPLVAVASALVLPLGSLIFGLVLFSAFAGVVATGVVLLGRSVRWGVMVSVASLLLPAALANGATILVPDGSQIYTGYWSMGRLSVSLSLYLVAIALVVVAGLGYRTWAHNDEAQAALRLGRRELSTEAAVVGERSRLARDLHDVVAHHVSLIAVRAETAPYTVPDLQPAARVVLSEIAEDSRKALDELRGVLGVLRRGEDEQDLAPQPTGADIDQLVAKARATGSVTFEGAALLAELPATVGYVAYRVVQEALTNARRHAPGEAVSVAATGSDDGGLTLRVSNRADGVSAVTPGRGLTGMRERVEAVGGTLSVDVRGGDLVVEVHLP